MAYSGSLKLVYSIGLFCFENFHRKTIKWNDQLHWQFNRMKQTIQIECNLLIPIRFHKNWLTMFLILPFISFSSIALNRHIYLIVLLEKRPFVFPQIALNVVPFSTLLWSYCFFCFDFELSIKIMKSDSCRSFCAFLNRVNRKSAPTIQIQIACTKTVECICVGKMIEIALKMH